MPSLFHAASKMLAYPFPIVGMHMAHESAAGPLRQKRLIPKNLIVQQRTGGLQRGEVELPFAQFRGRQRKPSCRVAPAQGLFRQLAFGDVAGNL